ncbi:hypothetical protein AVEN_41547-1, partial [Araneus ventricosus]
ARELIGEPGKWSPLGGFALWKADVRNIEGNWGSDAGNICSP